MGEPLISRDGKVCWVLTLYTVFGVFKVSLFTISQWFTFIKSWFRETWNESVVAICMSVGSIHSCFRIRQTVWQFIHDVRSPSRFHNYPSRKILPILPAAIFVPFWSSSFVARPLLLQTKKCFSRSLLNLQLPKTNTLPIRQLLNADIKPLQYLLYHQSTFSL